MSNNNSTQEITYNDIIMLCKYSENIEIPNEPKYTKNEDNKNKIINELNNMNFCTLTDYIKLDDEQRKNLLCL